MGDVFKLYEVKDTPVNKMARACAEMVKRLNPGRRAFDALDLHIEVTSTRDAFVVSKVEGMQCIAKVCASLLAEFGLLNLDVSEQLIQYIGVKAPVTFNRLQKRVKEVADSDEALSGDVEGQLNLFYRRISKAYMAYMKKDYLEMAKWLCAMLVACIEIAVVCDADLQALVSQYIDSGRNVSKGG